MRSAVFDGLLVVLLVLSNLPESDGVDCSNTAVINRLSKCVHLQLSDPNVLSNFDSVISKLCGSVDCSIACYEGALRDCTSSGIFRTVDLEIIRVIMRYSCDSAQVLAKAVKNCGNQLLNWACFDAFNDTMLNITKEYSSTDDSDAYVTGYCSASQDSVNCAAVTQLTGIGNCTAQQATMLHNLYDVSMSNARCGIAQNNQLFTTYGGPSVETTCGAENARLLYVVLIASLLSAVFCR